MEREDLTVLAYRFAGDRFCNAERFAAYEAGARRPLRRPRAARLVPRTRTRR